MTKEDYMMLPKERLAELLAEIDATPHYIPVSVPVNTGLPCTGQGECTNPFHDCVNCHRIWGGRGYTTTVTDNMSKL